VPTAMALCAIGVPVALMLFRTIAEIACANDNPVLGVATLVGTPVVAMLLGFLFALFFIAYRQGRTGEEIRQSVSDSLKPIVGILMIIGGGGAFNGVLKNSGIGDGRNRLLDRHHRAAGRGPKSLVRLTGSDRHRRRLHGLELRQPCRLLA